MTSLDEALLTAYDLSLSSTSESIRNIVETIKSLKSTSKFIIDVWNSNRYPYTVMLLAAKIGMYIPPLYRSGMAAFKFFMNNVKYYEPTFHRQGKVYPSPEELFLSRDKLGLLMQFRDDEILRKGVKWNPEYSDRKQMILKVIDDNINNRGYFTIDSNSRSSYTSHARIILFHEKSSSGGYVRLAFNIEELGKAIDVQRKVVWTGISNSTGPGKEHFDPLSLIGLRNAILEKFGQWKDRAGYVDGPGELLGLVQKLDEILPPSNNISVYLANPGL